MKLSLIFTLIFAHGANADLVIEVGFPIARLVKVTDSVSERILTDSSVNSAVNQALAAGDINGDGVADLVKAMLPPATTPLLIYMGFPLQLVDRISSGSTAAVYQGALAVVDVNGDGFADLVTTGRQRLAVKLSNGDGTFQPAKDSGWGSAFVSQILATDVNQDGNVDLVVMSNARNRDNASSRIVVEQGDGSGQFRVISMAKIDTGVTGAKIVGKMVVFSGLRGRHSGRTGLFQMSLENAATPIPIVQLDSQRIRGTASMDLNGDGHVDLLYANGDGVFVRDGSALGSFGSPRLLMDTARFGDFIDIEAGLFCPMDKPCLAILESASTAKITLIKIP